PLNPDPRTSPDGSPHVLAGPLSTTGFKGDSPALNASIAADKFVLAAGPWSGELARLLGFQVPVYPARGQILIFEMKERFLSCPVLMGKDHVYYYLGPKPDGHLYAGTTVEDAGFDTKCTDEALERIGEETAAFVPRVNTLPIRGSWAGLRPATRDNLPIIGRAPGWDNLYVATGHFRKGILLSAVTGKIMADLVLGRKPPLSIEEFSVDRFAAAKGARHVF
ncbi:MAG: FAD-dependent oxidoreductase, partial [Elusimicrobia bacterium]|nr:FAD-dependent oxidoreductase [Elusimicrobiota bacterium]